MGSKENITNADIFMLLKEIKNDNEEIKINIKQIQEDLYKQTNKVEELNNRINVLETENEVLHNKVLTTQRQTKKNNVIIFGIPEEEDAKKYFNTLIKNKLEIDIDEFDINNIYRIGTKVVNKHRAVILEFVRYTKKQEIFNNIFKLKGTGISVANDLPQEEREQQKLLYKHLKLAKDKKLQAKISKNKLIINGESYTYEQLKNSEVEDTIPTKTPPPYIQRNHSAPATPSATLENPCNNINTTIWNGEAQEPKTKTITQEAREINNEIIQTSLAIINPPSKSTRSYKKPNDTIVSSPVAKKVKK